MGNESDTRAELIDPKLKESGWGRNETEGAIVKREFKITNDKVQTRTGKGSFKKADFVLTYKNQHLAVIEAKREIKEVSEGVQQAKKYAKLLQVKTAFSTNGKEIYKICMRSGKELSIDKFPTPEELWKESFKQNTWLDKFGEIQRGIKKQNRFYQDVAINKVLEAISDDKKRILLTMATGVGKTHIASEISWVLFQSKWNLNKNDRRPRILFLTDRNILADQAF